MLTHRAARRKLGSRRVRRSNTNGKSYGATKSGRAIKRRDPKPASRKVAVEVARLVKASMKTPTASS